MVNSNQLHDLVEAISVLTETFDDTFDLKFSQSRFSIMAATSPSSRCILALQLSPSFFDVYACNKLEYKLVYIQNFYHTKFNLQRNGFTELGFACFDSDQEPGYQARNDIRMLLDIDEDGYLDRNAVRIFANPEAGTYERNDLPFCASTDRMDDTFEFDCANFVSIESQEFINIITRFSNFDNVLVTLSSSQVKFSYGSTQIILTKETCFKINGRV
ncbi:unnamed protein product [Citrullus colocynthis]|uniref:Proliferating cell nuclear antigen n=1 Tax=Citrullus colocynthis TaxID=252529 RepID=A0ABP0ZC12_9ROSI